MTGKPDERYELTDLRTGEVRVVDLATAAMIMKLATDEIRCCLEECGVCKTERFQLTER